MEFLSSLFVSIAAFLGFGGGAPAEPAPQPTIAPITQEADRAEDMPVATESAEPEIVTEEVVIETSANKADNVTMDEVAESEPEVVTPPATIADNIQTMIVAGGCFWCVEADMEKIPGVINVVSGYSGGTTENPTYQNYGSGGHREVVEVTYNANLVSFEDILIVAMKTTDPTDDDGTFKDRGDKYSPAFYYDTPEQKQIIEHLIAEVDQYGPYDKPLSINVEPRAAFWPAEDYHQDYYKGTLSQLKYKYYRNASGRDDLIIKYWGVNDHSSDLPWRTAQTISSPNQSTYMWSNYKKPSEDIIEQQLDPIAYKVTQEEGTEKSGSSPLDKNYEPGIYVDILSGEPLYSSKDKYDSGSGWPSFVRPITSEAVTEHEDDSLFTKRTEIRSSIADNHLGHVFTDGPADSTGLRYCMNGAALRFIPKDQMEAEGYGDFLKFVE